MAKNYNTVSKPEAYIPENIIKAVLDDVEQSSVTLTFGRRLSVPSSRNVIPLPSALPDASWVDGYQPEPKPTTGMEWKKEQLQVFECAAIIGIPDAFLEDSAVPVWDEIRPYAAQAIARKLDQAAIFGEDKPDKNLTSVVELATKAGSVVKPSTKDVVQPAIDAFQKVGADGYEVQATATAPGFEWNLASAQRDTLNFNPYDKVQGRLFGMPFKANKNGGWDANKASLIAGAWDHLYVGVRRDIKVEFSNSAVIRDPATKEIQMSAFQDDMTIMRITFRAGWRVLTPVNALNRDKIKKGQPVSPFAVLAPGKKTS